MCVACVCSQTFSVRSWLACTRSHSVYYIIDEYYPLKQTNHSKQLATHSFTTTHIQANRTYIYAPHLYTTSLHHLYFCPLLIQAWVQLPHNIPYRQPQVPTMHSHHRLFCQLPLPPHQPLKLQGNSDVSSSSKFLKRKSNCRIPQVVLVEACSLDKSVNSKSDFRRWIVVNNNKQQHHHHQATTIQPWLHHHHHQQQHNDNQVRH